MRNILDNSFYAIKKIKIKIDKKNTELQKDIGSVLLEIRYLARLKSEYIVNYNHSWVEVNFKQIKANKQKMRFDFNNIHDDYDDAYEEDEEVNEENDLILFEEMKKTLNSQFDYHGEESGNSIEFFSSEALDKKANYEGKISFKTRKGNKRKFDLKKKEFNQVLKIGNKTYK